MISHILAAKTRDLHHRDVTSMTLRNKVSSMAFIGPVRRLLLQRSRARVADLEFRKRKRSLRSKVKQQRPPAFWLPAEERGESYTYFQREGYRKQAEAASRSPNITLPPPGEQSFMDWAGAQSRSFAPAAIGVRKGVSSPIRQRGGSTAGLTPLVTSQAYRDPSTSRSFKRTSEHTDQQVIRKGGSALSRWNGQVVNTKRLKGFQSSRRPAEPTPRQRHTMEMKKEPYSFLT